ncbi:unnamed protein product, partial [Adineta steineri]
RISDERLFNGGDNERFGILSDLFIRKFGDARSPILALLRIDRLEFITSFL